MNKRILSILVENTAGVLSRVSGLFSQEDTNIDSLSVGITTDPNYLRMTVVCSGDELILEQITKQEKLEDVLTVKVLKDGQSKQPGIDSESSGKLNQRAMFFDCGYFPCKYY